MGIYGAFKASVFLFNFLLFFPFSNQQQISPVMLSFLASSLGTKLREETKPGMQEMMFDSLRKVLRYSIDEVRENITEQCYHDLRYLFYLGPNTTSLFYMKKLILDTSKNKNDLTTYTECMKKQYFYNVDDSKSPMFKDPTLLVTYIDKTLDESISIDSTFYPTSFYYFGICVPNVCEEDDFSHIIRSVNDNLNDLLYLSKNTIIRVYKVYEQLDLEFDWLSFLKLLPAIIIGIHLLLIAIFNFVPELFYRLCFKKKDKSRNEKRRYVFNKLRSCFNINKNFDELFNFSVTSTINNYSGLTYIQGLKSLSMIFIIFGFTFFALLNTVAGVYGQLTFIDIVSSLTYPIYFIGLRYSPRILLSCSGFLLFFKFMNFLDDKIDEANRIKTESNMKVQGEMSFDAESEEGFEKREPKDVKFSYLVTFISYQLHKCIMNTFYILFMFFSLYKIVVYLWGTSPLWINFHKENLSFYSLKEFFFSFFGLHLFGSATQESKRNFKQNSLFVFNWMVYNEIFFFLIGSIIIFIGYKKRLRIDKYLIVLISCLVSLKIVYFLVRFSINVPANKRYRSSLYYYFIYYGRFILNPLHNLSYFLIGLYFGIINYTVQKGFNNGEAKRQKKDFLYLPIRFVEHYKKVSRARVYVLTSIFIFCVVIICIMQFIILSIFYPKKQNPHSIRDGTGLRNYLGSIASNIVFLIDMDIFVPVVHWGTMVFYIKGSNVIHDFLSHKFWTVLDKCYFSFIMTINGAILYILAVSESRVMLNKYNIFLYSLLCGVCSVCVAFTFYILFELPLKRLVKLIVNKKLSSKYLEDVLKRESTSGLSKESTLEDKYGSYGEEESEEENEEENENENGNENGDEDEKMKFE